MKEAIDLCKLIEEFGSEDKCRTYLEMLRWHDDVKCPKCGSDKISRIRDRHQFDCDSCRYQFSVTAGTAFHDTHLPLWKWFLAAYVLCESRKGVSANQIKRMLGVSYKTAWYLMHRIRAAMKEVNPLPLAGTVEMDETYVGGKKHGACIRGRGAQKEVVIGIRQRGGDLRFFHAANANSRTLTKYIQEHISGDVDVIVTDDFAAYPPAIKKSDIPYSRHKSISHSSRKYVEGDVHTNTVESLLKRGIIGTWHRVSAKHLAAYLDEMCFRFNNRKNPYLFRDTMLRLLASPNVEYKELTAA
jgi:transposase-like protein